ncbi:predicted protein [Lichtheimia corymbifera JMRC:FSU:9682]|uniref:F-box domain-containing protein n=1 Tax=Lichtheimia corymbifera JMRC:FSU:9682 TaxID=1263082 RepID=A0A068S0L9_9FUNG|nr:predicted protein [Lichtheimia corymbifera JMRC:FSU:9682]
MIHTYSTTRLKESLWNDVCQQPTITATRPQYEKLASDSTTQLQQCIQDVLHVLNDRATVLTLSANFATALRDATAMQEISPLSPLGYLREATIYSEQGRQQAAIDTCNEGLSVVDINDPGYSKLEEAKMVAMQRDACRLDFVSQLPFEVVTDVLFPMLMDDDGILDGRTRCPYLDVSKAWIDRASQACGGGFHFKIADQCTYPEVIRLAQYTKSIRIESISLGRWIPELFQRAKLCSLRELKIEGLRDTIKVDHLVSSLKSVRNTLTHLTIWESTNATPMAIHRFTRRGLSKQPLRLGDILINCPHMVMLDIAYQLDIDFSAAVLTRTWSKLTTLSLNCRNSVTFNGQFVAILKRFPSLKKLVLNPCFETQPMTIIRRYCPSMTDLQLKVTRTESSSLPERFEQLQWLRGGDGLERISISEDSRNGDVWTDVCLTLKQHHNTLVHLEFNLDYGGSNNLNLFNLEYPCIKTLALQSYGSNNACFGWWIMKKAPFLEELSITAWAIESHPALLDSTLPPTLRKLVLDLRATNNREYPALIETCLNRFGRQKEKCSLKELNIQYDRNGDIPATHAAAICSLKTLQHLTISSLLWKQSEMDRFTKMIVEGCPHLVSLELDGPNPSAYAINLLKRLQHLQHLAFTVAVFMDYKDVLDAFEAMPQLKSSRIFGVEGRVNREFISCLNSRRPDIKIVY